MSQVLEGIVVVDLSREYWASLAAALLGDFGARVIRVEDLSTVARDPGRDGIYPVDALGSEARLIHRNKESVALALADDAGRDLLGQLVSCADVLLTDAAPASLKAWGLSDEDLLTARPEFIYAVGSLAGPEGPASTQPPLDELAAARSGVMYSLPEPGQPPVNAGAGQMYTSVMLALGIVTALHHRHETGEGQRVDASLLGGHMYASTLTLDAYMAMREDRLGEPRRRFDAANPMSGISYPSQDGRWVTLTMPDTDRWWPAFSKIVGLNEDDERFDTHEKRCGDARLAMMEVLEGIFATRPAAEWRASFDAQNLSADIIERYDYPAVDPNARKNRYVIELDDPKLGKIKSLGFPIHMSDTPAQLHRPAPAVGEDSEAILKTLLGLTAEEVGELVGRSTVGIPGSVS
ncbi:MAG: CoA transferase [Myxococcota bacterium]|nr:CoA transferase [Myxococcota bacterium]